MILFINSCESVECRNDTLILKKEGEKVNINHRDIEVVVFESMSTSVSVYTLIFLGEQNIPVIFCDNKHIPKIITLDLFGNFKVSERLKEQISWSENKKIKLWKQMIEKKIEHQKNLLSYLNRDEGNKLEKYLNDVENKETYNEVNGLEAISAKVYFEKMFNKGFNRKDKNLINSSLNYGYSLLRSYICTIVVGKGLHPSLGICHKSMYNEFNLADDIIEVYRPLVDYGVCIGLEKYKKLDTDFKKHLLLTVTQTLEVGGNEVSFKRSVELYVDSIINFLNGDEQCEIPKIKNELNSYE